MRKRYSLRDEYDRLAAITDGRTRGIEFEAFIGRVFSAAGFRVVRDPASARPRQTDLLVTDGRDSYLVETKWTRKRADIGDVDELFTRLDETPAAVVGVFVSVSGFSRKANERVSARRTRPMLLIDGSELESIIADVATLKRLLRRKQRHLLAHAEVLIGNHRADLPPANFAAPVTPFFWPDGSRTRWLDCGGGFDQFVFVLETTDIDWYAGSHGVDLDVRLALADVDAIVRLLAGLAELGWADGAGHWSIQQVETNWHGIGAASLVEALGEWQQRYATIPAVHHTEQLCYQNVCEGGFYTLSADIAASDPRVVWHSEFSLQLEGVPVDGGRLEELCELLEADQPLYLRPRSEPSVRGGTLGRDRIAVRPVAYVVQPETDGDGETSDWVYGLVFPNPFPGRGDARPETTPKWWPHHLAESDLVVASLRHWHPLAEPRSGYRLEQAESAETADVLVLRLVANW